MTAAEARELARRTPNEDRVRYAIRQECLMDQSLVRIPKEWLDGPMRRTLEREGYKVTEGWYIAYKPGWIIQW